MAATGSAAGDGMFSPLAAITNQFPGWRIWRSDAKRLWATRIGARLPDHPPDWWAMTVSGDDADELLKALAGQAKGG